MAWTREQRLELRRKVWELKVAGRNGVQIAAQLQISRAVVSRMLSRAREEARASTAATAAEDTIEQVARLDRMLTSLWDKVRQGNERAIDTALRVEERRAKLLGLDAVVRNAVDVTSGGEAVRYVVSIPVVERIDDGEAT